MIDIKRELHCIAVALEGLDTAHEWLLDIQKQIEDEAISDPADDGPEVHILSISTGE